MIDNRIESFDELEGALNNLKTLSEEISKTFAESQIIYEEQDAAWHSANSTRQSEKMMDYAGEAEKIAKNVNVISDTIQKFKTTTRNIDEEQ